MELRLLARFVVSRESVVSTSRMRAGPYSASAGKGSVTTEVNRNARGGQARTFPADLRTLDARHLPWCACLYSLFFTVGSPEIRERAAGEPATGRPGTCCQV